MKLLEKLKVKQSNLLSIYVSAGYPRLDSLPVVLELLEAEGVDFVEVGIPFSDPISDGPTIQKSNSQALENGITMDLIFQQLERSTCQIPVVMMGYFNTILQYGVERFCQRCSALGIDGVIIPDLPIEIYLNGYDSIFESYDVNLICLITPETSSSRIRWIDKNSKRFIYAVSSSSTTGKDIGIQGASNYLKRIREMDLRNPILVGFNIRTPKDLSFACRNANGGIIGSAFIKYLEKGRDLQTSVPAFISHIQKKPDHDYST